MPSLQRGRRLTLLAVLAVGLLAVPSSIAGHVTDGVDVKVSNDNNNVEGPDPTPSWDAKNRQANETTVAINPLAVNIVAAGANDYRMVPIPGGDAWLGFAVSADSGATWFETYVPGFPNDASPTGLASGLKGLDASGDPVVRFLPDGDLIVAGIAFNRDFDKGERPLDNLVYVARYNYTPGTPGGTSTPTSAANPPNYTFDGIAVVQRGSVGFAVPSPQGFAGRFTDKEWLETDRYPSSPCSGNVYVTWTSFQGVGGNSPIRFSASTDGGETFSPAKTVSTGGKAGTAGNQGSDIAVGPDGAIYVAYHAFERATGAGTINLVKSTDCGKKWSQPLVVGPATSGQAPGVAFRTPTFAFVAADDTSPNVVYVAYQHFSGDYDVYVQRSTDGGETWGAAFQVNEDPGARHQIFPTIDVSNGDLHVAWNDFRNSVSATNEALDVYYASSNTTGVPYPAFSHNERVTDVSHNGNCLMFGGGTAAFHGDYIELDARWDGANHVVHVAWPDNRDVAPCDTDPAPGPASNNTGNRNGNIYADRLTVAP